MEIKSSGNKRENATSVLRTYNIGTGKDEVLCEFNCLIESPNWSADGSGIFYNSRGRIFRYDIAEKTGREIRTGFAVRCNNDHVLSFDGKSLAVSHNTKEDGKSRIYTLPAAGGAPVLITPMAPSYLHGWSPDGSRLVYCAERNGEFDVYSIPAEGGEEQRLTCAAGLDDGPEYDSAGEYIWFNSVRTGLMQIWRMRPDGKEQTQMTFDDNLNSWFPHVSPDRRNVVMLSYRKGDLAPDKHLPDKNVVLRLMSAEGGKAKTVVELFGGQGSINVNSWSPDSEKFAFVSYRYD